MNDCESNNGYLNSYFAPQSMDEVARLCRYLGNQMGAIYNVNKNDPTKNETGVSDDAPVDCVNRFCGLNASPLKDYNEGAVIKAIKDGKPVLASGYSIKYKLWIFTFGYDKGHAWVYDGYISAYKNGRRQNLIHCNWGWLDNRKNGYYVSKAFNKNNGPEITDSEITRSVGEVGNLQFLLKYSIISR